MVTLVSAKTYVYNGITFLKGVPTKVSAEVEAHLLASGYFKKEDVDDKPAAKGTTVSKPAAKSTTTKKVAVKSEDKKDE